MGTLGKTIYGVKDSIHGRMAKDAVTPQKVDGLRKDVAEGKFSVSTKTAHGKQYIRFREKGTGRDRHYVPFDEGLYQEFRRLVPPEPGGVRGEGKGVPMEGVVADVGPPRQGRPPAPSAEEWREWAIRFGIGTDVLMFWEFATTRGYPGSLGSFINDAIRTYFEEHGVDIAIMVSGMNNVARNQGQV